MKRLFTDGHFASITVNLAKPPPGPRRSPSSIVSRIFFRAEATGVDIIHAAIYEISQSQGAELKWKMKGTNLAWYWYCTVLVLYNAVRTVV